MIKLLSKYLKHYIFYIIGAFVLIAVQTYVQMVLLMGQMKSILDNGVAKQDMSFIYSSGIRMAGYTLLLGALTVAISYLTSKVSGIFLCRMRKDCYAKVLGMTPEMFDHFGGSTLTTRTINDPKAVVNLIQLLISRVVMIPMVIICILGLIYIKSRDIFAMLLTAFVMAVVILAVLDYYAGKRYVIFQRKIDRLNQVIGEKITGVRTIRAFGNEKMEEEKGIALDGEILDAALHANQPMKFMNPVTMIIFNWVMVLIYYLGTNEVKAGLCSISDMILIFQYLGYFIMALSLIPTLINMLPKARVSVDRILELLEYEENKHDISKESEAMPEDSSIECRNVTFGYDKDRPALVDISFTVTAGSTLGVVGPTGSGKSTLLQLLMGFYEIDGGDIMIGGHSVKTMSRKTMLDRFSYASQKALVFQDTIRNNVTAFSDDVCEEAILSACQTSCFDEVINGKPEGLDMEIAQGGMNLSGGQRKRLALARTVCRDADIYLLDDPYAALDAVTESKVSDNMKKRLKGKTVVIVSSRISSVKEADNIIVLEQGKMVGFGNHQYLLENCSTYKEIYDTQCYEEDPL